ncbi:aldehyde-activating protein [Anopheles sinensis]|uniref:Aldehyde-activating protein n=1 Tax=Anopheles sinensis TaxID=74873 RepID=A0A084W8T3_ANOSI|nr:aldehyde-activating protein [Anopheles sinensis]
MFVPRASSGRTASCHSFGCRSRSLSAVRLPKRFQLNKDEFSGVAVGHTLWLTACLRCTTRRLHQLTVNGRLMRVASQRRL